MNFCIQSKLNQELANYLNRPNIRNEEIKIVIKSLPDKRKFKARWIPSRILPDIQRSSVNHLKPLKEKKRKTKTKTEGASPKLLL